MSSKSARRLVAVIAVTAGALGLASASWACVPQPLVTLTPQASGAAGSQVTVNAINMSGSVEIRWNGPVGTLLTTVEGPAFATPIKIPTVEPGLYTVTVVERSPEGNLGNTGIAAFLVTGPGAGTAASSPTTTAAPGAGLTTPSSSDKGVAPGLAAAGGGVLLVLGVAAGAVVATRRTGRRKPAASGVA